MAKKLLFYLSVLLFFFLFYISFIERYLIQVNTYHLYFRRLPQSFDGIKILQISDLHYGFLMPIGFIQYVLGSAMLAEPDMIVGTGDYVKKRNDRKEIDIIWPQLQKLQAPLGVYMVLGNHDHWADSQYSLQKLQQSGFSVRHTSTCITRGGGRLCIGGAGDHWEDKAGIDRAFANSQKDDFRVLLAHNPDTADSQYKSKMDLILAGHTHGGQFRIPFWDYAPIIPVKNKKYDAGVRKNKKGETIFISKGIGWSILPIRFNCYPELAVLVLHTIKEEVKIHD